MDTPSTEEKSFRCEKCFKLLCKQDTNGNVAIKFQRLFAEIEKGHLVRIDCPRCGHTNMFNGH